MVSGTWFLVAHVFRARVLNLMKLLKGLEYSIEISLEVRGEGSLGWLGRIWSRKYIFVGYSYGDKGCRLWDPTIHKSSIAHI